MIVETLAVGTELLLGQIVNSNAAAIATRLADAGLDHHRQVVVGDNIERIADAIRTAVGRADALIITGGIGPTPDDLTREAICLAAGTELVFDEGYAERLRSWWERRGRAMPESNLRQAYKPHGAELLPNHKGTAPGLRVRIDGAWVFAVPGVPEEMTALLDESIVPFLVGQDGGESAVVVSRLLRTWGESESRIGELLGDVFAAWTNPTLAFLASGGEIKLRITAKAADQESARALIAPAEVEVRRRLGGRVFGADDETIEAVVLGLLGDRGWTIGTAESATGGMVAARLTSVPGSSAVYRGSVVAYHEDLKRRLLAVEGQVLEEGGPVSAAVAVAMAEGATRLLETDVAVAVTGSAGPEPQGREVGTMFVAVGTPDGVGARELRLPGDRERVRAYTTTAALHHVRLAVTGEWWAEALDTGGRHARVS